MIEEEASEHLVQGAVHFQASRSSHQPLQQLLQLLGHMLMNKQATLMTSKHAVANTCEDFLEKSSATRTLDRDRTSVTHISCRNQHLGQRGDVVVSVEPRHEEHSQGHVQQDGHQDVGFPGHRQTDRNIKYPPQRLSCQSTLPSPTS